MRRAGECQAGVLEHNHGRKQDKNLIEEHARQQLEIAEPVDVAHLKGREHFCPVAPFENQPYAKKDGRLDCPHEDRKRQPPRAIGTHVDHVLLRPVTIQGSWLFVPDYGESLCTDALPSTGRVPPRTWKKSSTSLNDAIQLFLQKVTEDV